MYKQFYDRLSLSSLVTTTTVWITYFYIQVKTHFSLHSTYQHFISMQTIIDRSVDVYKFFMFALKYLWLFEHALGCIKIYYCFALNINQFWNSCFSCFFNTFRFICFFTDHWFDDCYRFSLDANRSNVCLINDTIV